MDRKLMTRINEEGAFAEAEENEVELVGAFMDSTEAGYLKFVDLDGCVAEYVWDKLPDDVADLVYDRANMKPTDL